MASPSAPPEPIRCTCTRPSCTRPLVDEEVDDDKVDCDLDELEKTLEKNENGQQVPHGVPREGEDDDNAASSSDSDEEPTDYLYRNRTDDESDDESSLVDPGEGPDAESDCNDRFYLEGGKWRKRYHVEDSRKRDRNRQYDLQKYECKVRIERAVLLAKLACIGGSASLCAMPPDDKLETRFAPWKTVDWTKPDVSGVQAAMDGSRLQPQAINRLIAFFDAHPHIKLEMCATFCQEAYGVVDDAQPPRAYACLSEFQFDKSCMLEVMETAAGTEDDSATITTTTTTTDARMTLFYFTFEVVDEGAIAAARAVYGDFVPEYTYAGPLAQGHGQPDLNVWKIECARGRPFSAEAGRLTLGINGLRYETVLRSYSDFAMAPSSLRKRLPQGRQLLVSSIPRVSEGC